MSTTEVDPRGPEEIEQNIAARRASLRHTLNELEHRLSPGERIRSVRERISPENVAPWAAVGAIATGALLAARGLRGRRARAEEADAVCVVDVAVPPGVVS